MAPNMALTSPLFLLFLLPSLQAFSNETSLSIGDLTIEKMILQACSNIENQASCISNIHNELESTSDLNPTSILTATIKATLKEAKDAIQMITKFNTLSVSYREQLAIEDCKELLDFSVSELAWSLTEMKKIRAGDKNVHYEGNLKTWLSAALSNQDTCLEGFEESEDMDLPNWITDGDQELLNASPLRMHVDAIVALDGTGNYQTITEAISEAPSYSNRRYIIYVKKGVYRENIDMKRKKTNIMLVGDGIGETVVTGNRNFMQGWTTFRTATVAVSGKGFIARDMTFRNTAKPENHQAVALRVDSDQSAFFRCSMESHQDTLYAHSLRQFYRECDIYGTIDFIFGNGAAFVQNCKIFTRVPLPLQKVTITAQGRKNPHQSTGFVIQDSYILASQPTYLGRPWKQFSRTVFINTYMNALVQPRGWLEWYGDFALGTLWYGEYKNYGPGASLSNRIKWPGYHIINDVSTATFFTVDRFIDGRSWLPATGIKFTAGLSN
ncbi:putative pectinesterase/pectinesterase inhibitor 22 isoform X2 [Carica papaya]|uniref:putative pectinesterase/pectinesterase inhibitor 22 isoform X2 n=1 Tax=Carica papaya TaxID=3649 RepID=UPI000B8CF7D3|nr:putative pectinesterase/pectinesterase inhibitor 22 isoform X2 [Carica papaya]